MEAHLHLPLDHEQWAEYRMLKALVGPERASHLSKGLFIELGYQAQGGRDLGTLDGKSLVLAKERLGEDGLAALIESGFLISQQANAGPAVLRCERFVGLHGHLDPTFKSREIWGAERSRYVRDMRRYEQGAMQFALQIPEECWIKEDGNKMEHNEIGQVLLLIRGCDNALGLPERPQNNRGFSQTLVRCALAVVKQFEPDARDAILMKLLKARGNPVIPPTTEQLLAVGPNGKSRFGELAPILMKAKG